MSGIGIDYSYMEVEMKKRVAAVLAWTMVWLLPIFAFRCDKQPTSSLWDPDQTGQANPVIQEINPPKKALAGVTLLTIRGVNFSPEAKYNFVYFNDMQGKIVSATTTQLVVEPPNLVGDSIKIKIAVHGAELFSNIMPYALDYSAKEYAGIDKNLDANGIACDKDENLFVSLGLNKIIKITAREEKSDYTNTPDGFFRSLRVGPGGVLYGVRTRFLYQIAAGGASVKQFGKTFTQPVNDLDFDAAGNIYVAARLTIYAVKNDATWKVAASYPLISLNSIRVFNGYVYVAGDYLGTDPSIPKSAVWRNKILNEAGDLGPMELAFDWAAVATANQKMLSITFAEDGELYIGGDSGNAITIVTPNGDGNYVNGQRRALYPQVITPPVTAMVWGNGGYLYYNRKSQNVDEQKLIRVTVDKKGAPDYGRK